LLAPAANGPVATVEVAEPNGSKLVREDGIVARGVLLQQIDRAEQILGKEAPDMLRELPLIG
jgi:arginase